MSAELRQLREQRDALDALAEALRTPDGWLSYWAEALCDQLLTVYFGAPSMFITLWFGFDYGTNPPLGTLII
jgi:hypothetical protein